MNKAFSLIEILISVAVMSIISLSMANFSSDMFNVSFKHSEALSKVNQSRQLSKFLSNEINRAEYIFPSDTTFNLSADTNVVTVNTQNSVAFLIKSDDPNADNEYFLKVFYLKDNNIYLFSAKNSITWSENTMPATYFLTSTGSIGLVLSDIDTSKTTLSYTMNENNGSTDIMLKGEIGGAQPDDSNALIRGVDWKVSIQGNDYYLGGISQNVPRYIQK